MAGPMSRVGRRRRLPWQEGVTGSRFLRFNGVGAIGFALQLGVLALLLRLGLHYLVATALAVELTILHNFAWHECWTWKDRPVRAADPSTWLGASHARRLWRFHAANGVVSLTGNLVLMRLLAGVFGMPPVPANLLSVLACALVNFTASDRFVFRAAGTEDPGAGDRGT